MKTPISGKAKKKFASSCCWSQKWVAKLLFRHGTNFV